MTRGKDALRFLAERYPQLYLVPDGPDAENACKKAVTMGIFPVENDLPHFHGDLRDTLEMMDTPAGPVEILTLHNREDFERFLRIIAFRCRPASIPATQGASTLDGIVNWRKIEAHRDAFFRTAEEEGVRDPDWGAEFSAFTSDRRNYKDTMIVLSWWSYSNVDGARFGLTEEAWFAVSRKIRMYHELTHVICRRLYPEQIDPVWDELCADAVGIYAAFGRYDRGMEETFLGIADDRYSGGRLENYVKDPSDKEVLDALALRCARVLREYETIFAEEGGAEPFGMIEALEARQTALWAD